MDRDLLSCHAEVKALQSNLGTSYKDASHHLYMAEVEKLQQQDVTLKTYGNLKERMEHNLTAFKYRFSEISITLSCRESDKDTMGDPHTYSH
jgi:putative IMPACT (imprinted ancient) family translation regulator